MATTKLYPGDKE